MLNILSLKLKTLCTWFAVILMSFMVLQANAGELVYTPTNPSFGGNPNNASGLMAVANAQNNHKAPVTTKTLTPLEKFTNSVQSSVLSRLTRETVDDMFNDVTGEPILGKTVIAGNYSVIFVQNDKGDLIMKVTDRVNGGPPTEIIVGTTNLE